MTGSSLGSLLPLSRVRVVEIGQVLAGPFAGAIMADLGAEVIKVERPEGGDDSRMMGASFRRGDALNFHVYNRGKKSVTIDLKSPEGVFSLHTLIAQTDVLIHNLRPGVMEDFGLSGPELCERYRRLIYCEISGFGHRGPDRGLPSYEALIEAYSGLFSINGGPEAPPTRIGVSICDLGSGMWAVVGALALLQRRAVTGRGGVVNTSLLETALTWAGQKVDALVNEGKEPERHGSGTTTFVPYQAFDAADGPILICAGNDRLFAKLATALGHPEWSTDPRFRSNRARILNKEALIAEMQSILASEDRATWSGRLRAAGVPCSPINSLSEALAQPQVTALEVRTPVPSEDFALVGLPVSIDGQRPPIRGRAPGLGEHNQEILGERAAPSGAISPPAR